MANEQEMRKAFQYLCDEPRRFSMEFWKASRVDSGMLWESIIHKVNLGIEPPCGTVCCYAGAAKEANSEEAWGVSPFLTEDTMQYAARKFEITPCEAAGLFCVYNWERSARMMYKVASSHHYRLRALAAQIKNQFGFDFSDCLS